MRHQGSIKFYGLSGERTSERARARAAGRARGGHRLEGTDAGLEGRRASARLPTRPRLSRYGVRGSRRLREAEEG